MKVINENMSMKEICENYPQLIDIFNKNGIKGLNDKNTMSILGKLSLKSILMSKKINVGNFIELLNDILLQEESKVDIESQSTNKVQEISVMGLLPCPIRIPLLEKFSKFLDQNKDLKVKYELKAASAGLNWLKEDVIKANHPEKLADIFISAGFDFFFEEKWMGKFKKEGIFKDITGMKKYNRDFENNTIDLRDPNGDYSMLGVVPAVFLVNKDMLNGKKMPTKWEDILSPEFEKSISLPIADFDLFNSILIHIDKNYGKKGVKQLGKNLLENLHPAQMVKSDKKKENIPVVTIMPYFFTKMIKKDGPLVAVWPQDGAIISPIFMLTKKEKEKKIKKIVDFLSSKEIGEVFSHQGLFPSVNPEVDNRLFDKKFMWCGWDYIHKNDIGNILKECKQIFFNNIEE